MLDKWKERWTVRKFDSSAIPAEEDINNLYEMIQYIPSQLGQVDHIWCLLNPDDQLLKDWLVENIYYTDDAYQGHNEYFTALRDAPYMFTSFKVLVPPNLVDILTEEQRGYIKIPKDNETIRNNAFHAGILVSQSLQCGYNACQIACVDGWRIKQENNKSYEYADRLWERFGAELEKVNVTFNNQTFYFEKNYIGRPLMSVGVGKGIKPTKQSFSPYKDGVTFTGQKPKKWFNNAVR
jgi:nitroreductase